MLKVGESVEVVKYAHVIATGRIEEISSSGNVVWLEHSGPGVTEEGKELFMKSDGVTLRRA